MRLHLSLAAFQSPSVLPHRALTSRASPSVRLQLPPQLIPSAKSVRGLEKLSAEQQTARSEAFTSTIAETLTNADAETWERVKDAYPVLANLADEELQEAVDSYVNTRPELLEVLA